MPVILCSVRKVVIFGMTTYLTGYNYIFEHLRSKQSLDIDYCLSKLQEEDGHSLPGWTGYNYVLHMTLYIYISTKGRKHVALGLTMRHMTRSSSIIGILNGLGHSVSHSVVLEHDTALANKKLSNDRIVPEGFMNKIPTTVILNNNDFREETP